MDPVDALHVTSQVSSAGVLERLFRLGDVPGALWVPEGADDTRPLVLIGHGGGQHRKDPCVVDIARRFVTTCGFAVVAMDAPGHGDRPDHEEFSRIATEYEARSAAGADVAGLAVAFHALVVREIVPELQAVLDAVRNLDQVGTGPVGYWGVSLGCVIGVPFVAAEPRVRAAVLGLAGTEVPAEAAARVTVPVRFLMQWNDERVTRISGLALFDALGSTEKTLHVNPGGHAEIPAFEMDSTQRFFSRHLAPDPSAVLDR